MRKLVIGVATALVLVLGLVVFLAVHEFDSPDLGRTLLNKVGQATGVEIAAKEFKLRLLRGLVLGGVEATVTRDNRRVTFALDQLVFEHRLMPLLSGRIAVDKILLDRPRIDVVESAPSPTPSGPRAGTGSAPAPATPSGGEAPAAPGDDKTLSLELRELTINEGILTFSQAGQRAGVKLEGLTMSMNDVVVDSSGSNAGTLAALSGRGEIRLASATISAMTITDAHARFELANAKFDMPELALLSEYGRLTSKTAVDFTPTPMVYHLEARGDGIDVNKLVGSPGGFGGASVSLTADGAGTASKDLRAKGALEISPGKLPAIPTLLGIEQAVSKKMLVERPYKATDLTFAFAHDTLTLSPFRVEVDHARLELKGTAALAGALDVGVAVATPAEGVGLEGVSARVLDTVADAEGWVSIPIHITGTLEKPHVRPDTGAMLAQAKQGVKREAREAAAVAAGRAKQKAGAAIRDALADKKQ